MCHYSKWKAGLLAGICLAAVLANLVPVGEPENFTPDPVAFIYEEVPPVKRLQWAQAGTGDFAEMMTSNPRTIYTMVQFGAYYYAAWFNEDMDEWWVSRTADPSLGPYSWTQVYEGTAHPAGAVRGGLLKRVTDTLVFAYIYADGSKVAWTKSTDGTTWDDPEISCNLAHAETEVLDAVLLGAAWHVLVGLFAGADWTQRNFYNVAAGTHVAANVHSGTGYCISTTAYRYPGVDCIYSFDGAAVTTAESGTGFTEAQCHDTCHLLLCSGGTNKVFFGNGVVWRYERGVWSSVAVTSSRSTLVWRPAADLNPHPQHVFMVFFTPDPEEYYASAYSFAPNGGFSKIQDLPGWMMPRTGAGDYALLVDYSAPPHGAGAVYEMWAGTPTTAVIPAIELKHKMYGPRFGTCAKAISTLGSGIPAAVLYTEASVLVGTFVATTQQETTYSDPALNLLEACAADLQTKVTESFTTQTAAYILIYCLNKYCLYLSGSTSTITAPATTYTVSFKGTPLGEVLRWYAETSQYSAYWHADMVVHGDAGATDSTVNYTATELYRGGVTPVTPVTGVTLRGSIVAGQQLESVKPAGVLENISNWFFQNMPQVKAWIKDQTTLDTLATQVASNLAHATKRYALAGKAAVPPQVGTTVGVTYNVAPVSLAAETQLWVSEWTWTEFEFSLVAYDAVYPSLPARESTSSAQEVLDNYASDHGYVSRGDVAADDFSIAGATLTADSTWDHDMDLSAIVPANTKCVRLQCSIQDDAVGSQIAVRQDGYANTNEGMAKTQVANVSLYFYLCPTLSSTRKVNYYITNGMAVATARVIGWWI